MYTRTVFHIDTNSYKLTHIYRPLSPYPLVVQSHDKYSESCVTSDREGRKEGREEEDKEMRRWGREVS